MSEQELREALDGLFAYDTGAVDSGIHDEALRQKCIAAIKALPLAPGELVPRLWLSRLVRDRYLSEEALAQGYGIEDVFSAMSNKWLKSPLEQKKPLQ